MKNTVKTTQDGGPPVEVTITSPTKLVTKDEGESTLDTGEGIVAKLKPKKRKRKGGVRKRKPGRKAASPEKAIQAAQDVKGDFLTVSETADIIKDFEKDNKIKKRKGRKKKRRGRSLKQKPAQANIPGSNTPAPERDEGLGSKKPKRRNRKRRGRRR